MKISFIIFFSIVCLPLHLHSTTENSSDCIPLNFTSILYTTDSENSDILSTALDVPQSLPIPLITSHLLTNCSLLTTHDAQTHSLLGYLLQALIEHNRPTSQQITLSMIEQALLLAHQHNHTDIIQLLTNWHPHPFQSFQQLFCFVRKTE